MRSCDVRKDEHSQAPDPRLASLQCRAAWPRRASTTGQSQTRRQFRSSCMYRRASQTLCEGGSRIGQPPSPPGLRKIRQASLMRVVALLFFDICSSGLLGTTHKSSSLGTFSSWVVRYVTDIARDPRPLPPQPRRPATHRGRAGCSELSPSSVKRCKRIAGTASPDRSFEDRRVWLASCSAFRPIADGSSASRGARGFQLKPLPRHSLPPLQILPSFGSSSRLFCHKLTRRALASPSRILSLLRRSWSQAPPV